MNDKHRARIEQYIREGRTVSGGNGNPPDKRLKVSYKLPNDTTEYSSTVEAQTWDAAANDLLDEQPTATVTKIELA